MDERVADLLERWEELADHGQELSAEELCQDEPELVEELRWRIAALKKTSWVKQPLSEIESTAPKDHGLPTHLGRYRLDELIGSGGFGQVWRGFDPELHRVVALKIPRPERLSSSEDFLAEARRVASLRHPSIVTVHDVGQEGKVCYIVTDFLESGSLADNGQLEEKRAVEIVIQIADALSYAHAQGFIHRDIKPANVLLDQDYKPHLADFGIATTVGEADQQTTGTLAYMSPEQASGGDVDTRSDIYSLGVVLLELLTGQLPYKAKENSKLRWAVVEANVRIDNIPKPLTRILQNCLAKDRDQRYQSAAALGADLRLYLDGKGRRGGTAWAVALLLVMIVGAVIAWSQWDTPGDTPGVSGPKQADYAEDRRVAKWVLSMEGTVQIDTFRRIVEKEEELPDAGFKLIAVGFNVNRRLKDEDLARLSKLKHLERVILNACPITDDGLAHLRGMTTLEHLGLFGTEVTNEGLDHLAGLTELRWLSLSATKIEDGAIEKLLPLTKLKNLQIGAVPLTDDGIRRLPEMASLEIISLDKTKITDEGLLRLADLPYLYRLRVGKTGVTEEGVAEFQGRKPKCAVAWP